MAITTLSSGEFNRDTGRAKKAAKRGPVFITDRGRPAHVLLTIEEYQKIVDKHESIVDLLAEVYRLRKTRSRCGDSASEGSNY